MDFDDVRKMVLDNWCKSYEGSRMFKITRQIVTVRFKAFKWYREILGLSIVWDDMAKQCEKAQLGLHEDESEYEESKVRSKSLKHIEVQLEY